MGRRLIYKLIARFNNGFGGAVMIMDSSEVQAIKVEWGNLLQEFDHRGAACFTPARIHQLLDQIQSFVNTGLPADPDFDLKLRVATDAIFEAHLILANLDQHRDQRADFEKVSERICLAIKLLCN